MLPWFKLPIIEGDNYENILKAKMEVQIEEICKGLPESFAEIYTYIRGLSHLDVIDYDNIERLFYQAAKESDIDLNPDPSKHIFHWLLESKKNTDEAFFNKNMHHLQSCDSVLNKSDGEDLWDSNTYKLGPKDVKEEKKTHKTPMDRPKTTKRKPAKGDKGKKLGINQFKNYQSQANSFITKNQARLWSPSIGKTGKFLEIEYKKKMNKMLSVNANKFTESHNSGASSPSKLVSDTKRLLLHQIRNERSINTKIEGLGFSGTEKPQSMCSGFGHQSSRFYFPSNKLTKGDSKDHLFQDLPEESTYELEGELRTNKPLLFGAKSMNLKQITGRQL